MFQNSLQSIVMHIERIIPLMFGIATSNGTIISCSDSKRISQQIPLAKDIIDSSNNIVIMDNMAYEKIFINNKLEFISFLEYKDKTSINYLSLISLNILTLQLTLEEKNGNKNFIRNIIMGNIFPSDIQAKSRELNISVHSNRVVFLIQLSSNKDQADVMFKLEKAYTSKNSKNKNFIIMLDEQNIVLVKEVASKNDYKEIHNIASQILDLISTEDSHQITIAVGTVVSSITDISRSFKESQVALLVGKIFDNSKSIISYNNLGIGRLIYQLPVTLCKLFLKEVFKEDALESLDDETFFTIYKFFENNLNISETSRQLFIHRNTLVYRLDKIQKITGLDLRMFDDAITFKVATLVKKYLETSS